jgi:hypothetical protein
MVARTDKHVNASSTEKDRHADDQAIAQNSGRALPHDCHH